MLALVVLLACKEISEVASRSLGSSSTGKIGTAVQGQDLQGLIHHIADCRTDPASCGDAAHIMANYSDNMTKNVLQDINETLEYFIHLDAEFESCKVSSEDYTTSFDVKVATHTACREKQASAAKLANLCEESVHTLQTNKHLECTSTILTTPISDVQAICKPSAQQDLGQWLDTMAVSFKTRTEEFQKQEIKCKSAEWGLGNATDECTVVEQNATAQNSTCDTELTELESFSCTWANGFSSRCSAYNSCYTGVLARYNKKVADLGKDIEQWKQTWTAAKKMQCTSSAISSSDVVNATKMKECNSANHTNTSFIKVNVPAVTQKQTCAEPVIYPGSTLFRSKVYGGLPADVVVRLPTPCPWMCTDISGWYTISTYPAGTYYGESQLSQSGCSGSWKSGTPFTVSGSTATARRQKPFVTGTISGPTSSLTVVWSSGYIYKRMGKIHVLANDHTNGSPGGYFHFSIHEVPGLKKWTNGKPDEELKGRLTNLRSGVSGKCVIWGGANGGTDGDAHGRFQPGSDGQFQVGDVLNFLPEAGTATA